MSTRTSRSRVTKADDGAVPVSASRGRSKSRGDAAPRSAAKSRSRSRPAAARTPSRARRTPSKKVEVDTDSDDGDVPPPSTRRSRTPSRRISTASPIRARTPNRGLQLASELTRPNGQFQSVFQLPERKTPTKLRWEGDIQNNPSVLSGANCALLPTLVISGLFLLIVQEFVSVSVSPILRTYMVTLLSKVFPASLVQSAIQTLVSQSIYIWAVVPLTLLASLLVRIHARTWYYHAGSNNSDAADTHAAHLTRMVYGIVSFLVWNWWCCEKQWNHKSTATSFIFINFSFSLQDLLLNSKSYTLPRKIALVFEVIVCGWLAYALTPASSINVWFPAPIASVLSNWSVSSSLAIAFSQAYMIITLAESMKSTVWISKQNTCSALLASLYYIVYLIIIPVFTIGLFTHAKSLQEIVTPISTAEGIKVPTVSTITIVEIVQVLLITFVTAFTSIVDSQSKPVTGKSKHE